MKTRLKVDDYPSRGYPILNLEGSCHGYFTLCIILDVAPPISEVAILQDAWGYDGYENEYGEYIPYTMADLEWNGYEDEVTGEWISNLVVVYDPAMSKMPKQRWHRALNKINKVNFRFCIIYIQMV